jgi:hypothetical protein
MAGIFDSFASSFDMEPERSDAAATAVVNTLQNQHQAQSEDDDLLDVERLLAKAAYYKIIVTNGVVEEDGTPQAAEVNAEVRLWARQQMAKMVGRYQEPAKAVESPFSEKETMALKKLAAVALRQMGELPTEPVVKKVEAPTGPRVRRVEAPASAKKPAAPAPTQPKASKPQAPAAPSAPAKGKKGAAPPVPMNNDGTPNYEAVPSRQPFTDVDGTVCKMIDNPRFDPTNEGSKPRTKMKVTNQVRGAGGGHPPPASKAQWEMITQAQSADTISVAASASATSPFGYDKEASSDLFIAAAAKSLTT